MRPVFGRSVEVRAPALTGFHRWFLLILVSIGSVTIYTPAYLKYTYYTQLLTALHINNEQLGILMSAYAITATITYIPCGFLADRLRMRTLSTVGFLATAALTFWYATLPSFGWCIFIMIAMGVSTILIWWGVRYKLVRLISLGERDYARSIGISYGFYGAAGLGTGLVILWLLSAFGNNAGVSAGLDLLASLLLVMGVLSWLFIPRFVNETGTSEGAFGFKESLQALRRPAVYITAVCMFFVYFYYTCASYTSPYLTTGFAASLVLVSVSGNIRTYGVTIVSAPAFGWLAKRWTPSTMIIAGSAIAIACFVAIAVFPQAAGLALLVGVLTIVLGFVANGCFGVVSAQLTEARVPIGMFGAATGILSVVGFLPDSFSSTWFGALIDAHGNNAYPTIFWILAGSAAIAVASAVTLHWYVRRRVPAATADELAQVA